MVQICRRDWQAVVNKAMVTVHSGDRMLIHCSRVQQRGLLLLLRRRRLTAAAVVADVAAGLHLTGCAGLALVAVVVVVFVQGEVHSFLTVGAGHQEPRHRFARQKRIRLSNLQEQKQHNKVQTKPNEQL